MRSIRVSRYYGTLFPERVHCFSLESGSIHLLLGLRYIELIRKRSSDNKAMEVSPARYQMISTIEYPQSLYSQMTDRRHHVGAYDDLSESFDFLLLDDPFQALFGRLGFGSHPLVVA